MLAIDGALAEVVTEEREPGVLERAFPVGVLAVDDPRLVRVQLKTDLTHTFLQLGQHLPSLRQALAVNDRIVGIPFEHHPRRSHHADQSRTTTSKP